MEISITNTFNKKCIYLLSLLKQSSSSRNGLNKVHFERFHWTFSNWEDLWAYPVFWEGSKSLGNSYNGPNIQKKGFLTPAKPNL